jgi:hypothetical protein
MRLPNNNLGYPVKIIIGLSSGSGFIINHENQIYLITAKHVIFQQDTVTKNFLPFSKEMKVICHTVLDDKIQSTCLNLNVDFEKLLSEGDVQYKDTADVVTIKLGTFDNKSALINLHNEAVIITGDKNGSLVFFPMERSRKFEDVEITNRVFVLGYPISISSQQMDQIDYDAPLVRSGIVAGKNYKNKTIILDCPVYGGNSGGMALEVDDKNRNYLIGIVVQFVPFLDQWENKRFPGLYNTHYQNSGYSIVLPIDYIYDLIRKIEEN